TVTLIGIILIIVTYILTKRKRKDDTIEYTDAFCFTEVLKTGWEAKWSILTPVIILGGIYGGIFTPTEASVVAVVYGLLVGGVFYKELNWKELYESTLVTLLHMAATI